MKHMKSILSIFCAVALLVGSVPTVGFASPESDGFVLTRVEPAIDPRLPELFEQEDEPAEPEYALNEPEHEPDDVVRVAIILEDESAIDKGFSVETIGSDKAASDYQDKLCREQEKVVDRIEEKVLDGDDLDVVTRCTSLWRRNRPRGKRPTRLKRYCLSTQEPVRASRSSTRA